MRHITTTPVPAPSTTNHHTIHIHDKLMNSR
jgi:hypothetical protein